MSVLLDAFSVTVASGQYGASGHSIDCIAASHTAMWYLATSGAGYTWQPYLSGVVAAPHYVEGQTTGLIEWDGVANTVTFSVDGVELAVEDVAADTGYSRVNLHNDMDCYQAWARLTTGEEQTWTWRTGRDLAGWSKVDTLAGDIAWYRSYVGGVFQPHVTLTGDYVIITLLQDRLPLYGGRLLNAVPGRPLWLHRSDWAALVEETL